MGVRGRQGARTYSSGFYFILIVFLFWGRLKGKQQFPIGPKRVRKRSVFFLLIPNMYLLPPSNFLSSKSFFLLPGRVGFPLYLSFYFSCWSLQWWLPQGLRVVFCWWFIFLLFLILFPQVTQPELLWVNLAPQEGKKKCKKLWKIIWNHTAVPEDSENASEPCCFFPLVFPKCDIVVLCSHLKLCFRVPVAPAEISLFSRFHKSFKICLLDHSSFLCQVLVLSPALPWGHLSHFSPEFSVHACLFPCHV